MIYNTGFSSCRLIYPIVDDTLSLWTSDVRSNTLGWSSYQGRSQKFVSEGDTRVGSVIPSSAKEKLQRKTQKKETTKYTHKYQIVHAKKIHI